jgi:DNA-binding FadR family transcriptional regulator
MRSDSLTIRVTDHILEHIRNNRLSSGDALPSELKTSTELGVSRGVVREAFRALEVAGVLEKENGRSPKVGTLNSDFLTHLMVHALSTKQVSLRQIIEVRASIEVKAASLAAGRATAEEIVRLRSAVEGMRESVERFSAFVQHDLDFHQVINGAAGNPLIEIIGSAMIESIKESMQAGLRQRRGPEDVLRVAANHSAIVDAIERGDPNQAGAAMRKHFDETIEVMTQVDAGQIGR